MTVADHPQRILAVDELIDQLRLYGPDTAKARDTLALVWDAVGRATNVSTGESLPAKQFLQPGVAADAQRFAAASLLRVIATNPMLISEHASRVSTFKLFDAAFHRDLYPSLKLDAGDDMHEKERQLTGAVDGLYRQLDDVVASFESISTFPSVRHELQKALNSTLAKAVLWPFLSRELVTVRFDEMCQAVSEYLAAPTDRKVEVFDRLRVLIDNYSSKLRALNTAAARRILFPFANKLTSLIDDDFRASPLSKPASLRVRPANKKYPFAELNADLGILLTIENEGPGHAIDVEVQFSTSANLRAKSTRQYLGAAEPGTSRDLELRCRAVQVAHDGAVVGTISWRSYDGTARDLAFEAKLEGQREDLNWTQLAIEDPYSLEPVEDPADLVGRAEAIGQLIAKLSAKSVGSFYVFGQKRVGKTSIVRSLERQLRDQNRENYVVIYVDGGDYVHPEPTRTIAQLGERLCREITAADPRLRSLVIPQFESAFAPLDEFLREAMRIVPALRIVVILDEFDQLPSAMYRRGPIGDSFFLTLRSLSGKQPFGFVLVGGEKLQLVLSAQGEQLNKFQAVRVDYFDKERHWSDFQDLIRRPVAAWFEVTDEALAELYAETAGNPFFAKLICNWMYREMVRRRDSFITAREVHEAVQMTLTNAGSPQFQHFWEDGIFEETGDREEERSMARRIALLAFADALRHSREGAVLDAIVDAARKHEINESAVVAELNDFERRGVLEKRNGKYYAKVRLFQNWLRDRGVSEIVTTLTDAGAIRIRREQEERLRVKETELLTLTQNWPSYKGRVVGPESVRAWLSQFGDVQDQRLMYQLLSGLRFYGNDQVRSKLRETHSRVVQRLAEERIPHRVQTGQRKRRDILVSYLGAVSRSGVRYAQLYADENQILSDNVIAPKDLSRELTRRTDVKAVVFADDFIGTGQTVSEGLDSLTSQVKEQLSDGAVLSFVVAVSGFSTALERIDDTVSELALGMSVFLGDPLGEADKVFSADSRIFDRPEDRERAKDVAYRVGHRLVKDAPFGRGNLQAAIVFEMNCPNNTLPILWARASDWQPLFPRL